MSTYGLITANKHDEIPCKTWGTLNFWLITVTESQLSVQLTVHVPSLASCQHPILQIGRDTPAAP